MYVKSPIFKEPKNENVKIWRYLDFTKLISLIHTSNLFFCRADKLNDPFEGSWTKTNVESRVEGSTDEDIKQKNKLSQIYSNWPRYIAINCWHTNEHESAAMWKLYLKSDEGIAIQSTYNKFKTSIIDPQTVYIGTVNYIDYENEYINSTNILQAFVHKRKSFEHEREIRAVVWKDPPSFDTQDPDSPLDFSKETITNGIYIKVDLRILIENIYIAPNSPQWFTELVREVIEKYGYKFKVIQSNLNKSPIY